MNVDVCVRACNLQGSPVRTGRTPVAVDTLPLRVVGGLGAGGYAVVVKAELETGVVYAMKVLAKHKDATRRDKDRLKVELRVMTEVPPSPFLQRCHMAFESTSDLFFVVDFVAGGDLFSHLIARIKRHGTGFSEPEARVLLAEICVGLEHMHKHGFVHRDIKVPSSPECRSTRGRACRSCRNARFHSAQVENIMLDGRGHVKLIDFGLAVELSKRDNEPMSPTGSLIYMSPEMLRDSTGGRHTDWWAVGVLAHELMTGRTPWSSLTDKKIIRKEIRTMNVAPPRRLSPQAGKLICSLLRQEHRARLGTKSDGEVFAASFFAAVDWAATAAQTAAPAFDPGQDGASDKDQQAALAQYLSRAPPPPDALWMLGLDIVRQHPEYCDHRDDDNDGADGNFF